jgi:hypothetical protein
VVAVSVTDLADESNDLVDQYTAADLICISATPPAAVMHARYLSRRLQSRLPEVDLVVGLWDSEGDLTKFRDRIGCDATIITTMSAALELIGTLTHPHTLRPDTEPQRGPLIMAQT